MKVPQTTRENALLPVGRWTSGRKALVLGAVLQGLVTEDEILLRHRIATDEFESWRAGVALHGAAFLFVRKIQDFSRI